MVKDSRDLDDGVCQPLGRGSGLGYAWVWDLRSVNGKGLDLRLRLPDWIEGLEAGGACGWSRRCESHGASVSLWVEDDARDAGVEGLAGQSAAGLRAALAALGRRGKSAARAAGFESAADDGGGPVWSVKGRAGFKGRRCR